MIDVEHLAERYVALWNEPDPEIRRAAIRQLWADGGAQLLQPPQQIEEAAAAIGFTPTLEARGHAELEVRVTRAYEEFVAPGEFAFAAQGDSTRLRDVVKLRWQMVRRSDGEAVASGLEFLVLDADGRIRVDYQFIES
jgi:hypothetical protein